MTDQEKIKKLRDILSELMNDVQEWAEPCDHDVGICWCSTWGLVQRASEVLAETS